MSDDQVDIERLQSAVFDVKERLSKLEKRKEELEAHVICLGRDLEFVLQQLLDVKVKQLKSL